jgi:hypothetical protein
VSIQRHCLYYVVAKSFPLLFRDQGISSAVSLPRHFLCCVITKACPRLFRYQGMSSTFVSKIFHMLCRY